MKQQPEPSDYIITRKRKKYRFALFATSLRCFEVDQWENDGRIDSLEVGAGTGLFSVALAVESPQKTF